MKKLIILAFGILCLTCFASSVSADGTLVLHNDSSYALGTVAVSGAGLQLITVSAPGDYPITLSSISSITINGQTAYPSDPDTLQLASGAWVIVEWVADGIEVMDEQQTARPS